MHKIPTKFLTESSLWHTNCVPSWRHSFVSQWGRLNHNEVCIVFGLQDAIIFIFIPVVIGVCSMDSSCSTIQTVIQIEWPASGASTTSVSISYAFYKKENGIDMTSRHSISIWLNSTHPFHMGSNSCCWEEELQQEDEKSSTFEGCNCGYALGWSAASLYLCLGAIQTQFT